MTDNLTITNERVDDIPVLQAQIKHVGLAEMLDKYFPTHGNWGGVSWSRTATV